LAWLAFAMLDPHLFYELIDHKGRRLVKAVVWHRRGYSVKWTFVIIAINVLVFLIQLSSDLGDWAWFAFTPALALDMPWIFVTSIFLHGDFTHLVFNMFALLTFGTLLENIVGGRRFLMVFFAAGIVGNLGYMVTSGNPWVPAIGASGAVFGVIGMLTVLRPWLIVFVGGLPMPLLVAAIVWALLDLSGLFAPSGVAHGTHLAGLLLGLAYGAFVRPGYRWLGERLARPK
jgi:membrane associated rhomboid family serine protease